MAPLRFSALAVAAVAVVASVEASSSSSTRPPLSLLPSLPSLPALRPLELSGNWVAEFLKELTNGSFGGFQSTTTELLTSLLKQLEGLLLPPQQKEEAVRQSESLRSVLQRQGLLFEKLTALNSLGVEQQLSLTELTSIKEIAQRLWNQYKELEQQAIKLMEGLISVLREALPDLGLDSLLQSLQQQKHELESAATDLETARNLFPALF